MSAGNSKRNIEIKAKLTQKEFEEKVEIAKNLTGQTQPDILNQHDVFFKVPNGRLKLRYEVRKYAIYSNVELKYWLIFVG